MRAASAQPRAGVACPRQRCRGPSRGQRVWRGPPLFDRIGTGLQLTQSGGVLLDAAQAASRVLMDAEEVLRAALGEPHGDLRMAARALCAQQLLGPVVAEIHQRYPGVRTHVMVTGRGPDP